MVIPIPLSRNADSHNVHFPRRLEPIAIKVKVHSVEMAYAITVHKIQGQTKDRLIVDLNHRPAPTLQQINFQSLYVSLSRVRKSFSLKLMPLHHTTSLEYLFSLKPPQYLIEWLSGFDVNGFWSVQEAKRNKQKTNLA